LPCSCLEIDLALSRFPRSYSKYLTIIRRQKDYVDVLETDENFLNEVESSHESNLRDHIVMQMWVGYNS
jgi:hypothetical protein